MGTSWVRIDVDFRDDPELVMGGWEAVALWPQVVAALKRADGALTDRDIEVFPVVERIPSDVWSRVLYHYKSVGLIVEGSCRWTSQGKGAGVNKSKVGWVTPRLAEKGNGPSRSTSNIIVGSQLISDDVEVISEDMGRSEDNIFNIVPRALSRPVLSCSVPTGSEHNELCAYARQTWGEKADKGKHSLEQWVIVQEEAHPNLDLLAEAKKARAYEVSKNTTYKAIRRMLSGWFNRAEGYKEERNATHWSGLNKREREQEVAAGNTAYRSNINGVSLWRDIRDGIYTLSAQDILNPDLPYYESVKASVDAAVGANADPYDHEAYIKALLKHDARPENTQNLTFAIDQIVSSVRVAE